MDILRTPQILLISLVAGWLNRQQQDIIDYLLEEIRSTLGYSRRSLDRRL